MLAPSKATPVGLVPTVKVPTSEPSLACSLVTLLLAIFATQMLAPSKATPRGLPPTVKVPRSAPSLARSLSTVLSALFTTQIFAPSRATPTGVFPTAMRVVRLALYQCRVAIWIGFLVELTTPFCAKVDTDTNDRAKTLRTAKRMDFDTTH